MTIDQQKQYIQRLAEVAAYLLGVRTFSTAAPVEGPQPHFTLVKDRASLSNPAVNKTLARFLEKGFTPFTVGVERPMGAKLVSMVGTLSNGHSPLFERLITPFGDMELLGYDQIDQVAALSPRRANALSKRVFDRLPVNNGTTTIDLYGNQRFAHNLLGGIDGKALAQVRPSVNAMAEVARNWKQLRPDWDGAMAVGSIAAAEDLADLPQ